MFIINVLRYYEMLLCQPNRCSPSPSSVERPVKIVNLSKRNTVVEHRVFKVIFKGIRMTHTSSPKEDRFSTVVGFSSAGIACLFPRLHGFYTSRTTAVLIPVACGTLAMYSWQRLLTKPLSTRELECSVCASIRGTSIALVSGCILPTIALALIGFKRRPFSLQNKKAVSHFFEVLSQPYDGKEKSYILGLWGLQGIIGIGLANWQYGTHLKS